MYKLSFAAILVATLLSANGVFAQSKLPSGITWYGKLDDGLSVAKMTERPILLVSAAPQCAGVPGMW